MSKREIKFRAWNGEKMISPDYISRTGSAHWKENSIPCYSNDVMQFTGLKDRNGVEIYEGDIISMSTKRPTAVIEYDYCSFVFRWIDKQYINNRKQLEPIFWNVHLFEVVGNIHANPHLI